MVSTTRFLSSRTRWPSCGPPRHFGRHCADGRACARRARERNQQARPRRIAHDGKSRRCGSQTRGGGRCRRKSSDDEPLFPARWCCGSESHYYDIYTNSGQTMKTFLVSASVLIAYTLGANADVICTRAGGCWETHKKIRRHGGAYRYLEHTIPSKSNPSVMVKRVLRPVADHPARTPEDRR